MRSNDPYRTMWRRVSGPAPSNGASLELLALRISSDASRVLRARARWSRAPLVVSIAAAAVAALAVSVTPRRQPPTLLGAVSGAVSVRTFEVAMVGPRDGAWLIAAAVGNDR